MNEPAFWNHAVDQIPWCVELQKQHAEIWQELRTYIHSGNAFQPFPQYGLYSESWEAFPLSIFEDEFDHHLELSDTLVSLVKQARPRLPLLSRLMEPLESAGHLRNVFVSRLLPGSIIHPHRGRTPNYLRIHLGLVSDPNCQITVGDTTQTWQVGQLLAFKDGGPYPHSVRHDGAGERIVISFDLRLSYVRQFIPEI